MKPLNPILWMRAMQSEAHTPPDMYDSETYCECHRLVRAHYGMDLQRDITLTNAVEIYRYLINNITV